MRAVRTAGAFLIPVVPVVVLIRAAAPADGDADIGGGLMLLGGLAVGAVLADRSWKAKLTWRDIAIGLVALLVLLGLTYGLDALE